MAKESSNLPMEIITKVCIRMDIRMGLGSMYGKMAQPIKEIFLKD